MNKKRTTTDGLEIIDDLYFKGRPEMLALLEEARDRLRVTMQPSRDLQDESARFDEKGEKRAN